MQYFPKKLSYPQNLRVVKNVYKTYGKALTYAPASHMIGVALNKKVVQSQKQKKNLSKLSKPKNTQIEKDRSSQAVLFFWIAYVKRPPIKEVLMISWWSCRELPPGP